MKSNGKSPKKGSKEEVPYKFSDQVTEEKIKKHLNDINDVISEEDIRNVKIPGEEPKKVAEEMIELPEEKKPSVKRKKKPGKDEDKQVIPWDIIDEK